MASTGRVWAWGWGTTNAPKARAVKIAARGALFTDKIPPSCVGVNPTRLILHEGRFIADEFAMKFLF
jgi:hypothetical protein